MQLQYKGEADLLEENYIKIINLKTAELCLQQQPGLEHVYQI